MHTQEVVMLDTSEMKKVAVGLDDVVHRPLYVEATSGGKTCRLYLTPAEFDIFRQSVEQAWYRWRLKASSEL